MSIPIDLIVTNCLHEVAEKIEVAPPALKAMLKRKLDEAAVPMAETVARKLLCDISHDATLPNVLKALAVVKAPFDLNEIMQRLTAVRDARRKDQEQNP